MLQKSSKYNGKAFFKEPIRSSYSSSCLCFSSIVTESFALTCKPHPSQVAWVVVPITATESKPRQQSACLVADTPCSCGWFGLAWFWRERERKMRTWIYSGCMILTKERLMSGNVSGKLEAVNCKELHLPSDRCAAYRNLH